MPFKLKADYRPSGDQPQAIAALTRGLRQGLRAQTLLGVTGSGKTFTVANVIEALQLPTLVIAHNKTLAAQLCNEFREFFPESAVEYFVSYYDYYQPEAYLPHSDTYIEKEAQINEEIDRLRHACTQALLSRSDVIVVSSVSAIYNLGSPAEYEATVLHLTRGQELDRRGLLEQLVGMQFTRTNSDLQRGEFRLHGQVFEIMPVNEGAIYRLEIGAAILRLEKVDAVTRAVAREQTDLWLFPAKHYVIGAAAREIAFADIRVELAERLVWFEKTGQALAAERLRRRVKYDLEMIKNIGYCTGIENYSRHFDRRAPGEPPFTLLDYFAHCARGPNSSARVVKSGAVTSGAAIGGLMTRGGESDAFLTVIDESHVTVPQIRGMSTGDKARKDTLIEHGFRLPSAGDNRPLNFDEFNARAQTVIFVSATPSDYELQTSSQVIEQVVRPTGLVDPEVIMRPITGRVAAHGARAADDVSAGSELSQVDDVLLRIQGKVAQGERALVTTLTKKMAEELAEYLRERGIKVCYLHSDIQTVERIDLITKLRKGEIDVIVGVNLLREGLDLPEVSLVAILDADKEGFLRSETSLIQTIGRAARNVNGQVIIYADQMTGSIERALAETERRREIQIAYNKKHGITPRSIKKTIRNLLEEFGIAPRGKLGKISSGKNARPRTVLELDLLGDARPVPEIIKDKRRQMREAARALEFELAAVLRDELRALESRKPDQRFQSVAITRRSGPTAKSRFRNKKHR